MPVARVESLYQNPDRTLAFELRTAPHAMGPGIQSKLSEFERADPEHPWQTRASTTIGTQSKAKYTQANIDRLHTISREPAQQRVAQRLAALCAESAKEQSR